VGGQPFAIAARIKAEPPRYVFDDLKLALGANAVQGSFSADTGGARPRLVFDLAAPALALSAIPVPAVPASAQAKPPADAARHYLIPDTAVSFAPLRWVDADGKLAIGKLTLASGKTFADIKLAFTNTDARFDMPQFSVGAFGGTLDGSAKIDASRSDMPTVNVKVAGRGLSLGALLAAAGHPREVRGGSTDVAVDLAMRGDSPREWASTATGNVRLVSGKATLVNTKIDPSVTLDKLNEAINPFRALDASTELVCAVVRFPIANGVAHVDRSIAMETSKLGVSASGTLDFRNETLDFQFNPKVRKGISIDIAGLNLADLVRVTGPFASPHVAIDAAGSMKIIASVGAAIGTSGLSAVAQQLLSWADGSGPGPCQVALEGGASRAAQNAGTSNAQPTVPIASDIGKALGKLFGR